MNYQNALAVVGAGSAHPGGWKSTMEWIEKIPLNPSMHVLEVGCGTGRTLLYLQQLFKCQVTGVDIQKKMVNKAVLRARKSGQSAQFHVADATRLPFADENFDLIITESVNVFLKHPRRAIHEYYRVLKNTGVYVDVEMVLLSPVDDDWRKAVANVYGAQMVPDLGGWKSLFSSENFRTNVSFMSPVRLQDVLEIDPQHLDDVDLSDPRAYTDREVVSVLKENEDWMKKNSQQLGYGIFINRKYS